jgi:DNA repair protein RadC
MGQQFQEVLTITYLSRIGSVLDIDTISSSSAVAVEVPMRRIVGHAINLGANRLHLSHNHPSGNPAPSRADLDTTRKIARIMNAIDIHIDDHEIIADTARFSFREAGLI